MARLTLKLLLKNLHMVLLLTGCQCQDGSNTSSYTSAVELKTPIPFADGQISTTNGICFSRNGDTLYTSEPLAYKFDNGRSFAGIFEYRYKAGKWIRTGQVQFDPGIDAYHPVFSTGNGILFFNSRSNPDTMTRSIPHNIGHPGELIPVGVPLKWYPM